MRRLTLCILLCLCCQTALLASPAYPRPHNYTQPDGSVVTLYAHGNEYRHYLTNEAGQIVERMEDGFYRVTDDQPALTRGAECLLQRCHNDNEQQSVARAMSRRANQTSRNYRGLVILVDFTDRSFRFSESATRNLYNGMLNTPNYTGYTDLLYGGPQICPGSVRDYFVDNSHGAFVPEFDIVGPIQVNHPSTFINTVDNTFILTEEILARVNDSVDFSRYDSDGDGDVDMFYIIYAGYSSMYQGNDERLVWPHATTMIDAAGEEPDIYYDGVRMARFACSAELYGWQQDGDLMIDGIGTIVHEFSHVLGFVDHYDTSSGYQEHPNSWDVMDGGNYSDDYNRTPCAYNSYEKAVAGFITPLDITNMDGDSISLRSTEISTDALVLHSQQEHVHFYMENRQCNKWDKYLVGHGMLVWRVDSVRPEYWSNNMVNVTTRACFRLVRAQGTQGSFFTGVVDTDEDPFPGTTNVTCLNNEPLAANLISFDQYPTQAILQDITEKDGVIHMRVVRDTLSTGRPITYDLPASFHATAERLVGEEWQPIEWDVTHATQLINGQAVDVVYNLLPNTLNISQSSSLVSGQFFMPYSQLTYNTFSMPARRLCLETGHGIWLANVTDVETGGGGSISFYTNRNGIPVIEGDNTELALLALKSTAYVATSSNLLSIPERYRNIRFSEESSAPDKIEEIPSDQAATKILHNGQIMILREGVAYTVTGLIINNHY